MKLKKFALRGLIALAVAVALCMFFARTVQTITTPKIRLVTASSGRLEQKMTFQSEVYFPDTEDFVIEDAKKTAVTVKHVYVKPGHYVKEGDTIFTAECASYEEDMKKLRDEYDTKRKELIELDIANRKLSRESLQNELYDAMLEAQDKLTDLSYEARLLALEYDITLSGDVTDWKKQLATLKEVPADVTQAVNKAVAASSAFNEAQSAFFAIKEDRKQRVKDEVFKYINDRNAAIRAMDELTGEMVDLAKRVKSLQTVKATRDGYIVSLGVTEGEAYEGVKAAYTMNGKDSQPILRASLSGVDRTIADDTKAELDSEMYGTEKTSVERTFTAADGTKYLYIRMPERFAAEDSSAIRRFMSDGSVEVNITYRAKKNTTLLTPSAVRGTEDDAYVWLIKQNWGGFMNQGGMTVVKTPVTVIERSDKAVSIEEDLSYQQIADREDRALSDGQAVMEYVQ